MYFLTYYVLLALVMTGLVLAVALLLRDEVRKHWPPRHPGDRDGGSLRPSGPPIHSPSRP